MSSACLFLFSAQGLGFLFRLWQCLKLWLQFDDHHVNSIGICEKDKFSSPKSVLEFSLFVHSHRKVSHVSPYLSGYSPNLACHYLAGP